MSEFKNNSFSYKYFVYDQTAKTAFFKKSLSVEEENGYEDLCVDGRAEPCEIENIGQFHLVIKRDKEELILPNNVIAVLPEDAKNQQYLVELNSSNFHKGMMRGLLDSSIQSGYFLLLNRPAEFFRVLSMMVVQDVCMINTYPVVMWLFVAVSTGLYTLDTHDIDLLLNTVATLNNTKEFHDDILIIKSPTKFIQKFQFLDEYLRTEMKVAAASSNADASDDADTASNEKIEIKTLDDIETHLLVDADTDTDLNGSFLDIVLSLGLRMQTNATDDLFHLSDGDNVGCTISEENRKMHENLCFFVLRMMLGFCDNSGEAAPFKKCIECIYGQIDYSTYDLTLKMIPLLIESVDMVPFPMIIPEILKELASSDSASAIDSDSVEPPEISENDVRQIIMMVESAVNHRKEFTIEISKYLQSQSIWKMIAPILFKIRAQIFRPLEQEGATDNGNTKAEEKKVDDSEIVAAGEA